MLEELKVKMEGIVTIKDAITGEVILFQHNKIHPENMALAIVQSLGNKTDVGPIKSMAFGNGAAYVSGVGGITYLSPNTIGINASLYNQTYSKTVDNNNTTNIDQSNNNETWTHVNGNLFSDLTVTCTLEYNEPTGQNLIDNASTTTAPYVFNEIGLIGYSGRLLTHCIFSPVEKSSNRIFAITYVLRTTMV